MIRLIALFGVFFSFVCFAYSEELDEVVKVVPLPDGVEVKLKGLVTVTTQLRRVYAG